MWATSGQSYDTVMDSHAQIVNLNAEALPRCFVLNEEGHIVMVCSAQAGQPIDPHFAPVGEIVKLPSVLERAVAVLAQRCVIEHTTTQAARLGVYSVKVQLLRGSRKTHKAVIVDRAAA